MRQRPRHRPERPDADADAAAAQGPAQSSAWPDGRRGAQAASAKTRAVSLKGPRHYEDAAMARHTLTHAFSFSHPGHWSAGGEGHVVVSSFASCTHGAYLAGEDPKLSPSESSSTWALGQ
eukprot:scaffold244_cov416-Prasinococcus_capsulatus_cf.AAC.9